MRLIAILLIVVNSLAAQKQDYIWLMGSASLDEPEDTIWGATTFDFAFDPPKIYYDPNRPTDLGATNSAISTPEGSLELYTNGMWIADSTHVFIQNGDTINFGLDWLLKEVKFEDTTFLFGLRIPQGALFLDHSNNTDTMHLFHQFYDGLTYVEALRHTTILRNENDNWEVLEKGEIIINEMMAGSGLTACRHANGEDWWILNPKVFHEGIFTMHFDGVEIDTFTQYLDTKTENGVGSAYFSSDGSMYGIANSDIVDSEEGLKVMVFDFDRCNGDLILKFTDTLFNEFICASGVFSPNNRFYYVADASIIYQYDLFSEDIVGSKSIVATYDGFLDEFNSPIFLGFLLPAPDGKVYIMPCRGSTRYMGRIEYPDRLGVACEVNQHIINVPTSLERTMPNYPNYRLGPIDGSNCDTLGVDNHPVAKYRYVQDSIDKLEITFVDLSYYRPETYLWDFGDESTSTSKDPIHNYSAPGVYTVCLTVSNENSSNTNCRTLMLGTTATVDEQLAVDISLFPNPVQEELILSFHDYLPMSGLLTIYDTQGREVSNHKLTSGMNHLRLSHLTAGVYLYQVSDDGVAISSGKLSKL